MQQHKNPIDLMPTKNHIVFTLCCMNAIFCPVQNRYRAACFLLSLLSFNWMAGWMRFFFSCFNGRSNKNETNMTIFSFMKIANGFDFLTPNENRCEDSCRTQQIVQFSTEDSSLPNRNLSECDWCAFRLTSKIKFYENVMRFALNYIKSVIILCLFLRCCT